MDLIEKIEILSPALLDEHRPAVEELKALARSLKLEFGWHYLLDQSWIIHQIGPLAGRRILDAGAGTGILQWYLASQGAEVISVDRSSRAALPARFRRQFRVRGLRPGDLLPVQESVTRQVASGNGLKGKAAALRREASGLLPRPASPGSVVIYNQDLKALGDIPTGSLDAVVGVSALEHNPPDELPAVVAELMRVLRSGGMLAVSLNAARDRDWFHQPSAGWCYTDASLRRRFGLTEDAPSNYNHYDELFEALKGCAELRNNLAGFYFKSDRNGMPWGKWDPQYIPVGVVKINQPAP
jgi:SAM-dependent methyltransferase